MSATGPDAACAPPSANFSRPGVDYVLIGRYNTADCSFDKLKGDLCYGLKKLHKLLNPEEKKHEPASEKPADLAD